MTKERELLKRALDIWGKSYQMTSLADVMQEIRAHLAAEEGKQEEEPAAWMEYSPDGKYWFLAYSKNPEVKTKPLFLHPSNQAEQKKPLSEVDVSCEWNTAASKEHHGIGGGDEQ